MKIPNPIRNHVIKIRPLIKTFNFEVIGGWISKLNFFRKHNQMHLGLLICSFECILQIVHFNSMYFYGEPVSLDRRSFWDLSARGGRPKKKKKKKLSVKSCKNGSLPRTVLGKIAPVLIARSGVWFMDEQLHQKMWGMNHSVYYNYSYSKYINRCLYDFIFFQRICKI